MSGIEQTLIQTLQKGDTSDVEFRRRVYNAAANALRRSLESQPGLSPDAVQAQKDRLADAIRSVEARMQQAQPPQSASTHVSPPTPRVEAPAPAPALKVEPRPGTAQKANKPEATKRSTVFRLRRGPFAAGLGVTALIGVLIVGLLWVMLSGAFQSQEARDTSVPNPPPSTGTDNFEPRDPGTSTAPALRAQGDDVETDWVTVFTPQDLTNLTLTGGATAEAASDPFGDYVRIITPPAGQAAVDLPIGPLQGLAGQRAQIEITAKTADGQTTQMAVNCDLGNQAPCVRTRFGVGQAEEAYIYRVDLSGTRRMTDAGRLLINSDIDGTNKEIKLLSIRVRPEADA